MKMHRAKTKIPISYRWCLYWINLVVKVQSNLDYPNLDYLYCHLSEL